MSSTVYSYTYISELLPVRSGNVLNLLITYFRDDLTRPGPPNGRVVGEPHKKNNTHGKDLFCSMDVQLQVIVTIAIVSWFMTHLFTGPNKIPTCIGVIFHLLSTMDILVRGV